MYYTIAVSNNQPNGFKAILEIKGEESCLELYTMLVKACAFPVDFFGYFLATNAEGEVIQELLPEEFELQEDLPTQNLANTTLETYFSHPDAEDFLFVYDPLYEQSLNLAILEVNNSTLEKSRIVDIYGSAPQPFAGDLAEELLDLEDDFVADLEGFPAFENFADGLDTPSEGEDFDDF